MNLRERLRAALPSVESLQRSRWLRPVAHRLAERELWRLRSEPVARGVAVGLFWAFAVPVAQIVFAALHCGSHPRCCPPVRLYDRRWRNHPD